MEEAVILNTSKDAASFETGISGWVSRNGRFWGNDERMARYDGCTHIVCECGRPVEKCWTRCSVCREVIEAKHYNELERKEWDQKTPLALFDGSEFFWSQEDLLDYCDFNEVSPGNLQLVICEPVYAREIDPSEYYSDDLPEDMEVDGRLVAAFDELNRVIRESKIVLSWIPGKYATRFAGGEQ